MTSIASDTTETLPELGCYAGVEHDAHPWYAHLFGAHRWCNGLDADTLFERTQDALS
jgi:hypothetical protein